MEDVEEVEEQHEDTADEAEAWEDGWEGSSPPPPAPCCPPRDEVTGGLRVPHTVEYSGMREDGETAPSGLVSEAYERKRGRIISTSDVLKRY